MEYYLVKLDNGREYVADEAAALRRRLGPERIIEFENYSGVSAEGNYSRSTGKNTSAKYKLHEQAGEGQYHDTGGLGNALAGIPAKTVFI